MCTNFKPHIPILIALLLPLQLVATISVYHIVGYSDWTETGLTVDGVVDWNPTIIQWGPPLHCEGHTVPTILLNSGGGSPGRRGEICWGGRIVDVHLKALPQTLANITCFFSFHVLNLFYTCIPCNTWSVLSERRWRHLPHGRSRCGVCAYIGPLFLLRMTFHTLESSPVVLLLLSPHLLFCQP